MMPANSNFKIKNSKLVSYVPFESVNDDPQLTKNKVCQMTYRSFRCSSSKFKTVNYHEYDKERKDQMGKRKKIFKPIYLYLDGANPSIQSSAPERAYLKSDHLQSIESKRINVPLLGRSCMSKALAAKKSLQQIVLKQIQLKKMKAFDRKQFHSEKLLFQTVEQLVALKKYQINQERIIKSHRKKLNDSYLNHSSFHHKNSISKPQKISIFSERNFPNKKSFTTLNQKKQSSGIYLSPLEDKSNARPTVLLEDTDSQKIQAQSYIVLKYPEIKIISGVAYKKNGEIASLTKIMTFYTILSICEKYSIDFCSKIVQICERDQQMSGTSAEIFTGEHYSLQQLLYGMMLPSGNDAAIAIANEGGQILKRNKNKMINPEWQNIECFVKFMNVLAKNIGMKTSTFANPHGLPHPQNSSNAYELGILISQCLKFEEFLKVTGTKKYSFWTGTLTTKRQVVWQNTHKLLRRPQFIGGKTGVTVTAGPCLATVYKSKAGQIFIIIVLKALKLSRRFKQTRMILGLSLKKLDSKNYGPQSKEILKSNPELDSDNSEDEQKFDFKKADSREMKKRNKILAEEM